MYKALRDAQSDINVVLLKLVDGIAGVSESRSEVREKHGDLEEIRNSIAFLNQKQNTQFESLVQEMKGLKENMDNILKFIMTKGAINTETTIPVIQPTSQESDFKRVFISSAPEEAEAEEAEAEEVEAEEVEAEEVEAEEVEEADAEVEVEEAEAEVEEADAEAEVEEADAEAEEAEAEQAESPETPQTPAAEDEETLEVEEWTYKGRVFFKDSDNTVYANNSGEIGDPMGQYDPIKNIVKKLPSN
jgi:regulator of protease activity HflC (stomatin/prohibitin superfamily)